jgi:Bacteriophage related domain of unknown function
MAIIPDRDVQSALNDALYDAFPAEPIAWENTDYNPTVGTLYLRPWLIPAEPEVLCLGSSPPWQARKGIFQVSVFSPIGVGFGAAKAKAAEIVAAFQANSSFVYNGLTVIIRKSWPGQGIREEDGWYHVPVSISYTCYSND